MPSFPSMSGGGGANSFSRFRVKFLEKLSGNAKRLAGIAAGVVASAWFVAGVVSTGLAPYLPEAKAPKATSAVAKAKTLAAYDRILSRNLFNERGLIPDVDDVNSGFNGPPVRTSLPLQLTGVILVSDELKSVASIEDKSRNQVVAVRVNDSIKPEVIVQKIESDKVIFINHQSGRREYVDLPKDVYSLSVKKGGSSSAPSAGSGIQATSETHFVIDRTEVDKSLANLNEILTQARCVPNFENGRPSGYRCFQIVPGSIYDKLGMKDNDVICGINGEPVADPTRAFEMLGKLKTTNNLELCLNRNGRVMNMNYDIR